MKLQFKYLQFNARTPFNFLKMHGIRQQLQGVERVRLQKQGLQPPSTQPAAIKPSQPARQTASQQASKPATQPAQPAQPAEPAQRASQPARIKSFYTGSSLFLSAVPGPTRSHQVLKHYDTRSMKNHQNPKVQRKASPAGQPASSKGVYRGWSLPPSVVPGPTRPYQVFKHYDTRCTKKHTCMGAHFSARIELPCS